MSVKPYSVRFTYLDGRPPYRYSMEPMKHAEAVYRFKSITARLAQENENGVHHVDLKVGNKIIMTSSLVALPSRWYVVREPKGSYFDREGTPWAICVPNSPRRIRHYKTEAEAREAAEENNRNAGVDKVPQS